MFEHVALLDAVDEVSAGNVKIPQSEYLDDGPLAVVDQGRSLVAGYTGDLSDAVRSSLPLIAFGDHTRVFKYLDFPFALGADGLKVLRVREGFDPNFVFHFLQSLRLPSAGYSRHFKFLKQVAVPKPPLPEQRRLAAVFNHAVTVREQRRLVLHHLDLLAQSVFWQMFATLAADGRLADAADVQGGLQVSTRRDSLPLKVPYLRVANVQRDSLDLTTVKSMGVTESEIRRTVLAADDLLFVEGHANPLEVGRVALWSGAVPGCVHQNHLIRARPHKDRLLPVFAATWLNSTAGAAHFRRAAKTTSGLNTITTTTVREAPLPLPPVPLQKEFADRVAEVTRQKAAAHRSLRAHENLVASVQARAFRGEL